MLLPVVELKNLQAKENAIFKKWASFSEKTLRALGELIEVIFSLLENCLKGCARNNSHNWRKVGFRFKRSQSTKTAGILIVFRGFLYAPNV